MKEQLQKKQELFSGVVVPEHLHADPTKALKPCAICGRHEIKRIYLQAHFPVVRCKNCGLIYADEHFTGEDLAKFYSGDYYQRAYVCHPPMIDQKIAGDYLSTFRRVDAMIPGGRVLDFGCARGTFLAHLMSSDIGSRWQIDGVDINPDEIALGCKAGLPVRVADVLAGGIASGAYDAITAFSVIEHLQQPRVIVEALRDALKPKGKLLLIVPNGACFIISLGLWAHRLSFGKLRSFSDNVFHEEHLYYFSPKTMPRFLELCGLRSLEVSFQPSYLEAHAPSLPLRILGKGLGLVSRVLGRETMLVAIAERA